MLKFSFHNSKLNALASAKNLPKKAVVSFDLPAGHTCPAASLCRSMADRVTGKITDGDQMQFRCYAASGEAVFTNTRKLRWNNFDQLNGLNTDQMVDLILASIPAGVKIIRIHSSGDFFNKAYFMAWVKVAQIRDDIVFFGYTKILPFVDYPKSDNFYLVYSFGGKMDSQLTDQPVCRVITDRSQAVNIACETDPADDYDFIVNRQSFAILLHGTQPAK